MLRSGTVFSDAAMAAIEEDIEADFPGQADHLYSGVWKSSTACKVRDAKEVFEDKEVFQSAKFGRARAALLQLGSEGTVRAGFFFKRT